MAEIIKKSFPAIITDIDEERGIVTAIVAVFGNVDEGNDRIWKGATTKTLSERFNKLRVLDDHNANSTLNVVGKPIEAYEIDRSELPVQILERYPDATGGLKTVTQYLIDTPEGLGVFKRIQVGAIDEYSVGFSIPKGKWDIKAEIIDGVRKSIRNIREIILYEFSPVIWGMNPATTTIGTKKMDVKAISLSKFVDRVRQEFENAFSEEIAGEGEYVYLMYRFWVNEVFDTFIYACVAPQFRDEYEYSYYKVYYRYDETSDTIVFEPQTSWIGGSYQFVENVKSTKSGRVLSSANREKLQAALEALNAVLEASISDIDTMEYDNQDVDKKDDTKSDTASPINFDVEMQRKRLLYFLELARNKHNA